MSFHQLRNTRGATLLAALAFLGVLGIVAAGLVGVQGYPDTHANVAAATATQTPAPAAPSTSGSTQGLIGCRASTQDPTKQQCACNQQIQTTGTTGNQEEICLPGCDYQITPTLSQAGRPLSDSKPKIEVIGGQPLDGQTSDPDTSVFSSLIPKTVKNAQDLKAIGVKCNVKVCNPTTNSCSKSQAVTGGASLSSPTVSAWAGKQAQDTNTSIPLDSGSNGALNNAFGGGQQGGGSGDGSGGGSGGTGAAGGAAPQSCTTAGANPSTCVPTGTDSSPQTAAIQACTANNFSPSYCKNVQDVNGSVYNVDAATQQKLQEQGYTCSSATESSAGNVCYSPTGGAGGSGGPLPPQRPGTQYGTDYVGDYPNDCGTASQQNCSSSALTDAGRQALQSYGYTCPSGPIGADGVMCTKNWTGPQPPRVGDGPTTFTPGGCTGSSCPPTTGGGANPTTGGGGNNSGIMGGLGSLLGGFGKGFLGLGSGSGSGSRGAPAPGNTTPQAPGTCQTQYMCSGQTLYYRNNQCVDQPMQYCQNGCSGNACSQQNQCQTPQQPSASSCSSGTWQPTYANGNNCITGWQCVPTNGGGGAAQLSCQPQSAGIGATITLTFSCNGAVSSQGSGFSTGGALSGTATAQLTNVPSGATTANYGLTCINSSGQTAGAQCTVAINNASIVLVANPAKVAQGQSSAVGWITTGMTSCKVSSPQMPDFTSANAGYTSTNGVATTSPITQTTEVDLNCVTTSGTTKSASTTITIDPNASFIKVSSSADGKTITHGSNVTVTWTSTNAPSNSAVALWLYDLTLNTETALIAGAQSTSGSYTWTLPASGTSCNTSSPSPCASDLVNGKQYAIVASVYSPANADLVNGNPTYSGTAYTATQFTMGD